MDKRHWSYLTRHVCAVSVVKEAPYVHRHPTLYRMLALIFLCIMLVLISMSASPAWPVSTRATLFMLSLFSLMLSLSYFHLGNQEDRGY
jgi:predicted membrane channel-forming protein YqfA (hemolysin III family)